MQNLYMLIERYYKVASSFFAFIIFAYFYTNEQFAMFSIVLAINGILLNISNFGMENVLIKKRISSIKWKYTFTLAYTLRISIAILVSLAVLFVYMYNDEEVYLWLLYLSLANIVSIYEIAAAQFRAEQNCKGLMLVSVFNVTSFALLKFVVAIYNMNPEYFFAVYVIESLVLSLLIGSLPGYSFSNFKLPARNGKKLFIKFTRLCTPLMAASFVSVMYMRSDLIMLSWFSSDIEVASFSAISKIYEIGFISVSIFSLLFYPPLVRLTKIDKIRAYTKYYTQSLVVGLFISITLLLLSEFLNDLLFPNVSNYNGILAFLLSIVIMLVSIRTFSGKVYIMESAYKDIFQRSVVGLCANIILGLLLIPAFAATGAVIATILSLLLILFGYDLLIVSKVSGINLLYLKKVFRA